MDTTLVPMMPSVSARTKKLLILEYPQRDRVRGYDHIFSFSPGAADSFPDQYLSQHEADTIYERVFQSVCRDWLPRHLNVFGYRGVDLLWCFKKALFEYAYLSVVQYETLNRVLKAHESSRVDVHASAVKSFDRPGIAELIGCCPLRESRQIHLKKHVSSPSGKVTTTPRGSSAGAFSIGNLTQCHVAVFSDYEKSKSVLHRLTRVKPVMISSGWAPRTLWRALIHGTALYQMNIFPGSNPDHEDTLRSLFSYLDHGDLFRDCHLGELDASLLLKKKFEHIANSQLPGLLGHIDQMHRFFQKAVSLKSALLDEDISMTKNAFCQIARHYRVKTYVECHGLLGGRHGLIPLTADKILMWGRAQKNKLLRWGCPEERILVSGCSKYSQYIQMNSRQIRNQVIKKLGLSRSKKLVVVSFPPLWTSWFVLFENQMRQRISESLEVMSEFARGRFLQFAIKLHPADRDNRWYSDWVARQGLSARIKIIKRYEPMLLAKAADFMIVCGSTYAVDGFALGKPVISLYDDSCYLEEYKEFGVFEYAQNKMELHCAIEKLASSAYQKSGRWMDARRECLNEPGTPPEIFIADLLLHAPS